MYHRTFLFRHDCYFCDLTDGSGLTAYIISEIAAAGKHKLLIEIRGKPDAITRKLAALRRNYRTYAIRIVEREKERQFVDFCIPQLKELDGKRPISKAALETGCFFNRMLGMPHKGKDGWEVIEAYSRSKSGLGRFGKKLGEIGAVKTVSVVEKTRFPAPSDFLNIFFQDYAELKLTPKEDEAVRDALDNGCYVYPRKTSIKDLAKQKKKNPKTIQEQLRKAEAKIVKTYLAIKGS